MIANINSTGYEIALAIHILTVMAGIGVTFWFGVYGVRGQRAGEAGDGHGAAALAEANAVVAGANKWVIYAIPVSGVGLVMMSDDAWGFDQIWVWLSLVLFGLALGLALSVLQPSGKRMADLARELASTPPTATGPPPQLTQIDALAKRLGMVSGINHLVVVVILFLMVMKPGA